MDNYVITISRKFGSQGHQIAGELGRRLEIPVYDRSSVEAQVRSQGLLTKIQAERQHQAAQTQNKEKQRVRFPWNKEQNEEEDEEAEIMFEAQGQVLREYVKESSCIILGRAGDEVFRDYNRCLNVYIFAPDQVRVENCVRMLNTSEQAARALIRREDKARDAYRARFCRHAGDATYGRHLLIDTSIFGIDESTKILEEAARYLFAGEAAGARGEEHI